MTLESQSLMECFPRRKYLKRCVVNPFIIHWLPITKTLQLTGIASGLAYLHRERIVHGDLRGVGLLCFDLRLLSHKIPQPNILVDDEGHMLLADFGLADFGDSTSSPTTSTQPGAAAWQAPELLDPETFGLSSSHVTYESDIFAFSSVCWEVRLRIHSI